MRREDSHEERWTPSVPRGRILSSGTVTCVHLSEAVPNGNFPSHFLLENTKMNF